MLKAIIIDDNPRDKEVLEMILGTYCSKEIKIIGVAKNVDSAYQLILENNPDVVFLDIELGNESGFDLLKKFTEYLFRVIFVTAYERYAVKAIKFNALDYVLKPVEIAEIINAVQKLNTLKNISIDAALKNLVYNLAHPHHKSNRVAIPVINGYKMVAVESILYCEAKKEYTNIYCTGQPAVCSCVNLGEYEELLQDYCFCRVHHSFLVNRDHVVQYIKGEGGELMMADGNRVPVSRRKKMEVIEWLKAG